MSHLRGFRAYAVDPKWKDNLPFDGDLKLQHNKEKVPEDTGHFFEVISRENDVLLTASVEDQIGRTKQGFLKNASRELCKLISLGAYVAQPEPVLYVYTIEHGGKRVLGILGDLDYQSYDNGTILPHEDTLANRIDIIATITQYSGVFNGFPIIFAPFQDKFKALLEGIIAETVPLISIEKDNVRHTVYKTNPSQSQEILEYTSQIPETFIADGHHRFKGFSKFIKSLTEEERATHTPDVSFFPVLLVSEDSLQIKKFHRVLQSLNGRSESQILASLSEAFIVSPIDLSDLDESRPDYYAQVDQRVTPRTFGHFSFYFHESRRWISAVQKVKIQGNAVESLDIQYLADHFFRDILGIPDLGKCSTVSYYPSIIGGSQFITNLDTAKISILCNEISLDEVKDVARNNLRMPPKATLFYPKPLLGMLFKVHTRLHCGC
jgi:uncharacterized protein (DUF1015 family)